MQAMRKRIIIAVLVALSCLTGITQAATYYWDANGTTAGFGTSLTGVWDTNAFWSTSSAGTATPIVWPVTANNDVIFSAVDCSSVSTVSVQNVLGPSAVNSVTTKAAAQTVKLSGLTSGRLLTMTNAASFNVENGTAAVDLDVAVNVAGSAGIVKTGAGTMRLYNSVNSYTGTTRIQQGTLTIGLNSAIPDSSAVVIDSGAALRLDDGGGRQETVGSIAGAGNLILKSAVANAQAFTSGGDNSSTEFSGVISSANATGWFVKTGTGTLTLSGDNTYAQETRVDAGGLLINGDQSAATGAIAVSFNAVLGGNGTTGGNIIFADGAKLLFDVASTLTADGATVDLGNLSVGNLVGLNNTVADGTYALIDGTAALDFTSVQNLGAANAADLGGGKSAYFDNGSLDLKLVVIPEPTTISMLGLGALIAWAVRRQAIR